MKSYFMSYEAFQKKGGSLKTTTITYEELLAVLTMHMERLDKQFSLIINGHLPKPLHEILDDAFEQSHLYKAFYTQHCANRHYRYRSLSKNRIKVDFTLSYRMTREDEKAIVAEMEAVLANITTPTMTALEKVTAVHDYIVRTYHYELETDGSPFSVATFMKEKRGVCMAYALLFEKFMALLSIPCHYVIGQADGEGDNGHAWNMVELDGAWYHIDVTWADISLATRHQIRYRYFLLTDAELAKNHQWDVDLYPPCTSERFTALHTLYDACLVDGALIYPHPKTAYLTAMSLNTLKTRKLADVRAQFCTYANDLVYFSNYSDHGTLTTYDVKTNTLTKLTDTQVLTIRQTEEALVIHYEDGHREQIGINRTESAETEANAERNFHLIPFTDVSMLALGESYLATFDAPEACPVAFKSADGVAMYIIEPVKQLTLSLEFEKGLALQMTSNRKPVQFSEGAVLQIPKQLIDVAQLEKQLKDACNVMNDVIEITCTRSFQVKLKK